MARATVIGKNQSSLDRSRCGKKCCRPTRQWPGFLISKYANSSIVSLGADRRATAHQPRPINAGRTGRLCRLAPASTARRAEAKAEAVCRPDNCAGAYPGRGRAKPAQSAPAPSTTGMGRNPANFRDRRMRYADRIRSHRIAKTGHRHVLVESNGMFGVEPSSHAI